MAWSVQSTTLPREKTAGVGLCSELQPGHYAQITTNSSQPRLTPTIPFGDVGSPGPDQQPQEHRQQ
eukprot:12071847-Heterocapsa_arctica.AAC.1